MSEIESRLHDSFARHGLMTTMGATLRLVAPGRTEIAVTPSPAITREHGLVPGGAVSALADTAAGYAALSLVPADRDVVATEYKVNFLAPAIGDRIVARASVMKGGSTMALVQVEVFVDDGGRERLVALMTATLMSVESRDASAG